MTEEVLKYVCPICDKELKSLYQKQLDFFIMNHKKTHEDKENKE